MIDTENIQIDWATGEAQVNGIGFVFNTYALRLFCQKKGIEFGQLFDSLQGIFSDLDPCFELLSAGNQAYRLRHKSTGDGLTIEQAFDIIDEFNGFYSKEFREFQYFITGFIAGSRGEDLKKNIAATMEVYNQAIQKLTAEAIQQEPANEVSTTTAE